MELMGLTQESNNEQLYQAALHGNIQIVVNLLKTDKDINMSYKSLKSGCTSLAAAVMGGYCRIVSLLIRKGADPNEEGKLNSLLFVAVLENYPAIVKLLLRAGVTMTNFDWSKLANIHTRYSIDKKMAHMLSAIAPNIMTLIKLKLEARSSFWIFDKSITMLIDVATEREKYSNILLHLYTRIKERQDELSDMDKVINMAKQRVVLEEQLKETVKVSPSLENYCMVADLGVQLLNSERSAASYCLLEEDCEALFAKYQTLLSDMTPVFQPLQDTQQFGLLKDFISLHIALKSAILTDLHTALHDGLLRPAIQLDQLPQQQLQQKQGVTIKQERY